MSVHSAGILYNSLPYFSEEESLPEPGAQVPPLGRQLASPRDSPVPALHSAAVTGTHMEPHSLYRRCWDMKSAPHSHTARTCGHCPSPLLCNQF